MAITQLKAVEKALSLKKRDIVAPSNAHNDDVSLALALAGRRWRLAMAGSGRALQIVFPWQRNSFEFSAYGIFGTSDHGALSPFCLCGAQRQGYRQKRLS